MRRIQPTLINFSIFGQLDLMSGDTLISDKGIIHTKREVCDICGNVCQYNGSSNIGKHILTTSSNSFLRKGQQYCSTCDKTIQVDNKWIDNMVTSFNEYVATQIISLSDKLSEDDIVTHLKNTMSIEISKSTVHNIISKSNEDLTNLEFDYKIEEGFYGYDEQFLMIDGKRAYRIVFYDIANNKVIYEDIVYKFSKKILQEIIIKVFPKTEPKPKGFVVDMKLEYPSAFRNVFGKKIKIQFCIFHLNKLILKEYSDALKIGKKVKWTLMHYYNMYCLFNIFYNRSFELNRLKKLMKHLEEFKMKLTKEKILFYVNKYKIKYNDHGRQREEVVEIIEKKLMKSFRKILHDKRNLRKKRKITLEIRSIESAKKKFENIQYEKSIFPLKIQKRIEKIKKNFEFFIASEGEVITNNKLEGFFGSTLKKFRKKGRKSLLSFSALLKRKRAQCEGIKLFRKFTIFEISKIFTVLSFLAQ